MAQEDPYQWLEDVDGKKASEFVEKQNKQLENKTKTSSKPLTPNVSKPTYSTRAPKK